MTSNSTYASAPYQIIELESLGLRSLLGKYLKNWPTQVVQIAEGISDYLLGEATLDKVLRPVPGCPNYFIISSGLTSTNPSELLNNPRLEQLIQNCVNALSTLSSTRHSWAGGGRSVNSAIG